jgi:hypothetical protein
MIASPPSFTIAMPGHRNTALWRVGHQVAQSHAQEQQTNSAGGCENHLPIQNKPQTNFEAHTHDGHAISVETCSTKGGNVLDRFTNTELKGGNLFDQITQKKTFMTFGCGHI